MPVLERSAGEISPVAVSDDAARVRSFGRRHYAPILSVVLISVAVGRILLTYSSTAQAFDEPCHVAAALEFLDKGTYVLDPIHPPLSRIAIGIPLYIAGERYPASGPGASSDNYNVVGNIVLYDSGHYLRNLRLARSGVLPFFVVGALILFFWVRRLWGEFAALMAVALFTTTPIVLAFSSLAYTDIGAACAQLAAFLALQVWLEQRTERSGLLLGLAVGVSLLAKATTLLFLPAAAVAMLIAKRVPGSNEQSQLANLTHRSALRQCAIILLIAGIVVWGGYRYSVGHVRAAMQLSTASMPSFQHFPAALRPVARKLVLADPVVPAPALLSGLSQSWVLNKTAPDAYLLGKRKAGGWWYFFLVGIAVKTPIPMLVLVGIGFGMLVVRERRWTALAPAACAVAVLAVTLPVSYNAGVRHVLVLFPLLAIIGGYGCARLWEWRGLGRVWARTLLAVLLVWQLMSTVQARHDYVAYFNELAGRDPSRVMVAGCDLDCGQDVFRLAQALRERHVTHVNLAIWSSADMTQMGLPSSDVLAPFQPTAGWIAVSERALRFGDVFHTQYPAGAFDWLSRYQPTAYVGKTILLYDIPASSGPVQAGTSVVSR